MSKLTSILASLILVALLLPSTGCQGGKAYYEGTKALWSAIEPQYVNYVNADTTLNDAEKAMRVGPKDSLAAEFKGLVEEEAKRQKSWKFGGK